MRATFIAVMLTGLVLVAMLTPAPKVQAQGLVGPYPSPRFWMSDYVQVGGDDKYSVFLLHDNKFREVCFLVMSPTYGDGKGITLTPRQC